MSFFSSIANGISAVAGQAVHGLENATQLSAFDLPDGSGSVRVFPAVYKVHLNPRGMEKLAGANDLAGTALQIMGGIAVAQPELAPVVGLLGAFVAAEWIAIRSAANSDGVTLRGTYLPPSPLVVPTPGAF